MCNSQTVADAYSLIAYTHPKSLVYFAIAVQLTAAPYFDFLYLVMGLCLPGNSGEAFAFGTLNPTKNQHGNNG